MPDASRYMNMEQMVEESGISRFTLGPALQTGELHGAQRTVGGRWRAERPCFEAYMRGEKCAHKLAAAAA